MSLFAKEELAKWTQKVFDPKDTTNCYKCGLHQSCKTPKMNYSGRGLKKCLIIAEAPGENEDRLGTQLIGRAGEFFRGKLAKLGLDLDTDFWKINAVNCFPKNVGTPTSEHISFCRPYLNNIIETLKPERIWLMGAVAVESFLGEDFKDTSISRFRGLTIPDNKTQSLVSILFHPSYVMRYEEDENLQACYMHDLKKAAASLDKEYRKPIEEIPNLIYLYNYPDIMNITDKLRDADRLFIDFETSGLKPYRSGHFIASISIASTHGPIYAFPYEYRNMFTQDELFAIRGDIRHLLSTKKLVAHNIKFEQNWSRHFFGVEKFDWEWDTMMGARCQDNRKKYCGLKFQTYINFGERPYDKDIEDYIAGAEYNRIEEIPLAKLLEYNGRDVFYTRELYKRHSEIRNQGWFEATDLFIQGQEVLADLEFNGICVDEEYYENADKELKKRIDIIKKELNESKESQDFIEYTGKPFLDWGSLKDLGILFYTVLKANKIFTEKGNLSSDKNSLEQIADKFPIGRKLLELRKLEKIKGTYLAQFRREVCCGKLHPSFDLVEPKTYRSSSSKPNFQNIPVREEEAKRITRSGIIPTKGNQILEADYSGIEVRISACYHKDPAMIKYIKDPTTDMHRDVCCDIFMLPPEEITKDIRFYGKNGWTFPQFYGSYWKECAINIWNNTINLTVRSGRTVKEHLASKEILTLDQFQQHCKKCEEIFWIDRFYVYDHWKDNINRQYQRTGFIESLFGFTFSGYMKYNDVTNYPIQATAFHCLLWTLVEVNKEFKNRNLKSRLCGQIHDSIFIDLCPTEKDEVIALINDIGTKKMVEQHPWIIVPMEMEFEISGIDEGWCGKDKVK